MNVANQVKPKLVIVEDYEILRQELCEFLDGEGFDVSGVDSGEELNLVLNVVIPDILVLDLNLPGEDGISIAKRIRQTLPQIAIVMMTARVTHADRMEGYQTGADVYLTKPVNPEELLLVLNNLVKRIKPHDSQKENGFWVFNPGKGKLVSPSKEEIDLTGSEVSFIKLMTMAPSQQVDVSELLFKLEKSDDEAGKAQLEALVSRLRRKINKHSDGQQSIKALWGKGYQLCIDCRIA